MWQWLTKQLKELMSISSSLLLVPLSQADTRPLMILPRLTL